MNDDGFNDLRLRELRYLQARSIAQEMLLRALMTVLASSSSDPQTFVFQAIEGMIASLDEMGDGPVSGLDAVLRETAGQELRIFAEQVQLRLRNIATGNLHPQRT